jgi:hypothetical protein
MKFFYQAISKAHLREFGRAGFPARPKDADAIVEFDDVDY